MVWRSWILAGMCALVSGPAAAAPFTMERVNEAKWTKTVGSGSSPLIAKAQVLLDRAFISPGAIDGVYGSNVKKALVMYQNVNKIPGSGRIDRATWNALTKDDQEPVLTRYAISPADVKGPFVEKIPASYRQQAKLKGLAYTSPVELLAEKFHMSEGLLKKLNPGANFKKAGTKIVVANVLGRKPTGIVTSIVVDKKAETVKAYDKNGKVVVFYPATVGSTDFPSPKGKVKVRTVAERPNFTYSAKLAYSKLKKGEKPLVLPPGPNNPVGSMWIDLNRAGYGIHGTPEPTKVSKAASHGCVRLTNWDVEELGRLVKPGIPVVFGG